MRATKENAPRRPDAPRKEDAPGEKDEPSANQAEHVREMRRLWDLHVRYQYPDKTFKPLCVASSYSEDKLPEGTKFQTTVRYICHSSEVTMVVFHYSTQHALGSHVRTTTIVSVNGCILYLSDTS